MAWALLRDGRGLVLRTAGMGQIIGVDCDRIATRLRRNGVSYETCEELIDGFAIGFMRAVRKGGNDGDGQD